jgi:cation diffusion facilitator family transporter
VDYQNQKVKVAALSVTSNSIIVILKAVVGILIGSVSVISEAIHSGMDLIAAIIALIAVRISGRSPDEEHEFGHGKVESISAAAEALLIFIAAIWIIYEAVMKIFSPHPLEHIGWGVLVMFISSAANIVVSQMLFKIGRKTESAALIADAWHLRTDVYTSAGVMCGLGLILLGGLVLPEVNLNWLDPAVAIIVAILILRAAYRLTVHAIKELIDTSTPVEEKNWIRDYITNNYPEIRSFHRLRTRRVGATRFIDFHMVVNADMTVQRSHEIGDKIVADCKEQFPSAHIITHIEPCDGSCTTACVSGCLLSQKERSFIRFSGSNRVKP